MTSGLHPCSDCGRNSPKGRHASCHVLALLVEARGDRWWSKSDLLRAAWPSRWAQRLPGEWPDLSVVDGAIATLRRHGHQIRVWSGLVKLRERDGGRPS